MVKEVKGVLLEFASTVAETSLIIPVPIVNSLELPKIQPFSPYWNLPHYTTPSHWLSASSLCVHLWILSISLAQWWVRLLGVSYWDWVAIDCRVAANFDCSYALFTLMHMWKNQSHGYWREVAWPVVTLNPEKFSFSFQYHTSIWQHCKHSQKPVVWQLLTAYWQIINKWIVFPFWVDVGWGH